MNTRLLIGAASRALVLLPLLQEPRQEPPPALSGAPAAEAEDDEGDGEGGVSNDRSDYVPFCERALGAGYRLVVTRREVPAAELAVVADAQRAQRAPDIITVIPMHHEYRFLVAAEGGEEQPREA